MRKGNDLPRIGRVGNNFLIPGNCSVENNFLKVYVKDTGIGIEGYKLEKIFENKWKVKRKSK